MRSPAEKFPFHNLMAIASSTFFLYDITICGLEISFYFFVI